MKIDQRALWVKSLLYRRFNTTTPITEKNISKAISLTGLNENSIKSRNKIVQYMWNQKHLIRGNNGKIYVNVRGNGLGLLLNFPDVKTDYKTKLVDLLNEMNYLEKQLLKLKQDIRELF